MTDNQHNRLQELGYSIPEPHKGAPWFEIIPPKGSLRHTRHCPYPTNAELAFQVTFAKWFFLRDNHENVEYDGGASTCGLCMFFTVPNAEWTYTCGQCPLALMGFNGCYDTPYYAAKGMLGLANPAHSAKCRQLIEEELQLLEKAYKYSKSQAYLDAISMPAEGEDDEYV